MKLEVGMYVRTLNGIVKIDKIQDNVMKDTKGYLHYGDFVKASYNIIDILEIGDYVNGEKVIYKQYKEYPNPLLDHYVVDTIRCSYIESEIKTIVTKEQFEQMAYKVVE